MSEKLWAGRFSEGTDKAVEAFTSSIMVDKRLYAHDIAGSIAHAKMMAKQGIIEEDEAELMEKGLLEVKADIENGNFVYDDALEDIHMHIESALTDKIGDTARKLHTGRSRNDQVALDIRLYLREETRTIIEGMKTLRSVIVDLAEQQLGVVMPGYTHLQRAQPVLFSHHMMAYYEMFSRDQERLEDALTRINVMPLGAAALAGTTYPIDRHYVAELLDFPKVSANSMDTVADRDFIMEFLSAASIAMVHFSRFSEELILWSSSEYQFIEISDGFTTGSSIMPQKKNPDIPELVRGKAGRVIGDLMASITLMKGLPMAYNRDMQEDKPPLFDGVDTLKTVVGIFILMLPEITVKDEVTRVATETGFLNATDLADYLATKGMPFREAHSVAGKAVAHAIEKGCELMDLSYEEMKGFSELLGEDIFDFLTTEAMVERRVSFGGTSPARVKNAINQAIADLGGRAE